MNLTSQLYTLTAGVEVGRANKSQVLGQVLLDIGPGKHMAIDRLERQLAIHKEVCPGHVYFIADMPLVVVRSRKDIDALCRTIPVILRIGQVQTGGQNFNMVILGRTGRTLVRRWGNGVGVSLHGREQPHAVADHGSLVHRIHAALRPAIRCCVTG